MFDSVVDGELRAVADALVADLDDSWPPPGLLADTPPGPRLAALLSTIRVEALSADDLVEYALAAQRLASWACAAEADATAELTARTPRWRGVGHDDDEVSPEAMAAAEIGAGLALSPVAARLRVEFARDLRRLPSTRLALASGRIDPVKARAIADAVRPLDDEAALQVEARVLPRAADQTVALLRAALRRAVVSVDPQTAESRRRLQTAVRGVWRQPLDDGVARLEWVGPAEQVESTYTWLTGKALQARGSGDTRTLDQARSDVLGDLGVHGLAVEDLPRRQGRRPQINVTIALSTLLGLDDEPAELSGMGPITAETARRIAAGGTWRRLLTDPVSGQLVAMSSDSYEPPQDMRDVVIARDRTCRGLGCRMPADRCDLDHRVPHPRGRTEPGNLDPACRSWHRVKTKTDTQVASDGAGGLVITLPSGRSYRRPAEPVLDHPGLVVAARTHHECWSDPDPPPF
jgi:hypothetical protein